LFPGAPEPCTVSFDYVSNKQGAKQPTRPRTWSLEISTDAFDSSPRATKHLLFYVDIFDRNACPAQCNSICSLAVAAGVIIHAKSTAKKSQQMQLLNMELCDFICSRLADQRIIQSVSCGPDNMRLVLGHIYELLENLLQAALGQRPRWWPIC